MCFVYFWDKFKPAPITILWNCWFSRSYQQQLNKICKNNGYETQNSANLHDVGGFLKTSLVSKIPNKRTLWVMVYIEVTLFVLYPNKYANDIVRLKRCECEIDNAGVSIRVVHMYRTKIEFLLEVKSFNSSTMIVTRRLIVW